MYLKVSIYRDVLKESFFLKSHILIGIVLIDMSYDLRMTVLLSSPKYLSSFQDLALFPVNGSGTRLSGNVTSSWWHFMSTSLRQSNNSLWFPGGSVVKNPPANAGDLGSIPWLGRSPGGGNGNPLQYSFLENSVDKGAW